MPNGADDPRMDARYRAMLAAFPVGGPQTWASRDALLESERRPEVLERMASMEAMLALVDTEEVAPSAGLDVSVHEIVSAPDGNRLKLQLFRPKGAERPPCVYYIHGGGMESMSAFYGIYRAWARTIANLGVAVALIDFRNSVHPSSSPEVAPYPAGLNDCVSGLRWVSDHGEALGIDAGRMIVAGESGGGNLAIATVMKLVRDGDARRVKGLYALCPYIAGAYPDDRYPSTHENNGILIQVHGNRGRIAYGIDAFEARDPLAWPAFATVEDVKNFPPTFVSVNECDPLRDEGIAFFRLLTEAGVPAQARNVLGTPHGAELMVHVVPEVSRQTAASMVRFLREVAG
jgi:acetyl esterase/lipase